MGCLSSKPPDASDTLSSPASDDGIVNFGNPLQSGEAGPSSRKATGWSPANEQSQEDMRRNRLMVSDFGSLVQKLRAGRTEHEFVNCLSDIKLFCELKRSAVPENGKELLTESRDALVRNGIRGKLWQAKAKAAFSSCMEVFSSSPSSSSAAPSRNSDDGSDEEKHACVRGGDAARGSSRAAHRGRLRAVAL